MQAEHELRRIDVFQKSQGTVHNLALLVTTWHNLAQLPKRFGLAKPPEPNEEASEKGRT